jgi:hypothetical protein
MTRSTGPQGDVRLYYQPYFCSQIRYGGLGFPSMIKLIVCDGQIPPINHFTSTTQDRR